MKRTIWMLLFVCIIFAACTSQEGVAFEANKPITNADEANLVSYEALWSEADAVFLGEVTYISATVAKTGSDDMSHQIAFSVLETRMDHAGVGSGVVMMVPGQSPVDDILVVREDASLVGTAVHNLKVGDQAIIFARITNLADSAMGPAVLMPIIEAEQPFLDIEHWENINAFASIVSNTN